MFFVMFAEAIERKFTMLSLHGGRARWQEWAIGSLTGGASKAHKFSKSGQVPVVHTPLPKSRWLSHTEVAEEASEKWQQVWKSADVERTARVQQAINGLKDFALRDERAVLAAKVITVQNVRKVATVFPKKTALA